MSTATYRMRWIVDTSEEVLIGYDGSTISTSYGIRQPGRLVNLKPSGGTKEFFFCPANIYAAYKTYFYIGSNEIAVFSGQSTYPPGSMEESYRYYTQANPATDTTGGVTEGVYVSKQEVLDDYFKRVSFKGSIWVSTQDRYGNAIRTKRSFIYDNVGAVFPVIVGYTNLTLWNGNWDENGNGSSTSVVQIYQLCSKFATQYQQVLRTEDGSIFSVSSRTAYTNWSSGEPTGVDEQWGWATRTFIYSPSSDGSRCYLSSVSTSTNFKPVNTFSVHGSVYSRLSLLNVQVDHFKEGIQPVLDESTFSSTKIDLLTVITSEPDVKTFMGARTVTGNFVYILALNKSDKEFWVAYGKMTLSGASGDYIEYAIYRSKQSNSFRAKITGTANQVNRLSSIYRYLGGEVISDGGCLPLNDTDRLVIASPSTTNGKFFIFDSETLVVKALSMTDDSFYRPIKADNNHPEIIEYIDTTSADALTDEDASSFVVYTQNAWQLGHTNISQGVGSTGNAFGKEIPGVSGNDPQTIDFETNPISHFEWDYHPGENRQNLSNIFTLRSEYDCRQNAFNTNINTLGFDESRYSNNALGYDPLRLRSSAIKLDVSNYNRIRSRKQQKIVNIDRLHLLFYRPYEVFKIGGNTENSGVSNHFENESTGYIDVDIYTQSNGGVMSMWMLGGEFHLYLVDRYQGKQLVYPKVEFLDRSFPAYSVDTEQFDTEWQVQGTLIMYPYRHYIMRIRLGPIAIPANAINDDEINPDDMWIIAFDYGKEMEWDRL